MPSLLFDEVAVNHVSPPDSGEGPRDGDDAPVRWVAVATFWSPAEAHLARLKLESEEIDCQIANENIVAVDYLLAPAVGGIKILVPEFEVERARALLEKPPDPSREADPTAFEKCPECGLVNIHRPIFQAKTFWAAVVSLMVLGPFAPAGIVFYVLMWRPWRCRDCGNVFRRCEDQQGFPVGQRSASPVPRNEMR
jgi:hypothetical protein